MNLLTLVGLALWQRNGAGDALLGGMMLLIFLLIAVGLYAYVALCLMKIAEKTNTENAWWAWVPILNVLLMLNVARKPLWWIVLLFIPLVNLVVSIMVFIEICKVLNKSPLLVIGMFIPLVNFVVLGYLAFSD